MSLFENIKNIMKVRGYENVKLQDEVVTFTHNKIPGKCVYLESLGSAGKNAAKIIKEHYMGENKQSVDSKLLIIFDSGTNNAVKDCKNISSHYAQLEVINKRHFVKNIFEHRLCASKYRKVTWKIKYKKDKLPEMKTTDPVCLVMGFKVGDVVEVTSHYNYLSQKKELDMVPSIYYRRVTE